MNMETAAEAEKGEPTRVAEKELQIFSKAGIRPPDPFTSCSQNHTPHWKSESWPNLYKMHWVAKDASEVLQDI